MTNSPETESEIVPAALAGERIDRVIATITARSRSWVSTQIADGLVTCNGRVVTNRSAKVVADDVLVFPPEPGEPPPPEADPSVEVVVAYEDDHVVVVNKPAGLIVHPGSGNPASTLVNGLLARYPDMAGVGQAGRPGIVHRLDKGTSGLVVVAKTDEAYDGLSAQMMSHSAARRYLALVAGNIDADDGLIDAPIGRSNRDPSRMTVVPTGREARTHYHVEKRFSEPTKASLVRCDLDTGRTHQIRVHLRSIGYPVLGDPVYGGSDSVEGLERPFLHASELQFTHPVTYEQVHAEAPLAAELQTVLDRFQ